MFRLIASTICFLTVLGLYFLYGWILVPEMFPEPVQEETVQLHFHEETREEIEPFLELFSPGTWERDPQSNIQLLTFGRTVILFRQDELVGNTAKLKPCTLIMLPENEEMDEKERIRQAVVLRTPDHAVIEFEDELSFSQFPLPKMTGGKLVGKVTITSDMKEPGIQDDLVLETENVAFSDSPAETTISTLKDVRFRMGFNSGEGSILTLVLALNDPKDPKSGKQLNRVQLESLKKLNLFFPEESETQLAGPSPFQAAPTEKIARQVDVTSMQGPLMPLAAQSREQNPFATGPTTLVAANPFSFPMGTATKVDVNCQREFCFLPDADRTGWTAGFAGNVEVVRTNPDGTRDFLNGEYLSIQLKPKENTQKAAGKDGSSNELNELEPVRFCVTGKLARDGQAPVPARLRSPVSGGVFMEGDQILYDLRNRQVALETETRPGASREVYMRLQDRYDIRGEKGFRYHMKEDGSFGLLRSDGKGSLDGTVGNDQAPKKVRMTWNAIQVEPDRQDPTQLLVQLTGGIFVNMQDLGQMSASKLNLWCSMENRAGTPATAGGGNSPFGKSGALVPDRAVIMDQVRFENANGTCDVKRLDIFFETLTSASASVPSRWMPHLLRRGMPQPPQVTPDTQIRLASGRVGEPAVIEQAQYRQAQHRQMNTATHSADLLQPLSPVQPVQPMHSREALQTLQPLASAPALTPVLMPGSAPQPVQAIPTNVYAQNLLGFQSGMSRSRYGITGDQMKMIICRVGQQSQVKQIWIGGNVAIREHITGTPEKDQIEITGEEIQLWNPSLPDTAIQISGKPPREASFRGKGLTMNAMEINIKRAENLMWIEGPGRLVGDSTGNMPMTLTQGNTPLPTVKPSQKDTRFLVEWSKGMSFDGKTLLFEGTSQKQVEALHQYQKMMCEVLMIHVNRFVSFFEDNGDGKIEPKIVDCAKNVYIENKQYDEFNNLKSFDRAEFDGVRIWLDSNDFYASGPGVLRTTFRNGRGTVAMPGGGTPMGDGSQPQYLCVWFHDHIQGNFFGNRKVADINGRVRCVFCTVRSWDDEIEINRISAATKNGYLLQCDQLRINQTPDTGPNDRPMIELTANGNLANIEAEGKNSFYGTGRSIKFNQAKSLVIFEGNAKVVSSKGRMPAQRIEYNIDTGAVSTDQTQGISIGGF